VIGRVQRLNGMVDLVSIQSLGVGSVQETDDVFAGIMVGNAHPTFYVAPFG